MNIKPLILPQRQRRMNLRRLPTRDERARHDEDEDERCSSKSALDEIWRLDGDELEKRNLRCDDGPDEKADYGHERHLGRELRRHRTTRSTEGLTQTDLPAALGDGVDEQAEEPERDVSDEESCDGEHEEDREPVGLTSPCAADFLGRYHGLP